MCHLGPPWWSTIGAFPLVSLPVQIETTPRVAEKETVIFQLGSSPDG